MPTDEFADRSKKSLVREIKSLRALVGAQDRGTNPRQAGGSMVDVAGDPNARGGVVLDLTKAVLMDTTEVCLVDPYTDGEPGDPILAMTLAGRVNKTPDRASIMYLFGGDGAAAIITELVGVAVRVGPVFAQRVVARLQELPPAEPPHG